MPPSPQESIVNYSYYFNHQDWWTDAIYQIDNFFINAGQTEFSIMACIVLAIGLICMRGFQVR